MKSCFAFLFDDIFLHKNLKLHTETVYMPLLFMIPLHVAVGLFSQVTSDRTRDSGLMLHWERFRLVLGKISSLKVLSDIATV